MKGNATEAAVLSAFTARGIGVLIPFGDAYPFDLVVHLGNRDFLRVQCKTGRKVGGCVGFNSRSTDHGNGPGSYAGRADIFGIYFPPRESVYLLPVAEVTSGAVQLRLSPARNNQRKRIRMANDYLIDRWSLEALRTVIRSSARRHGEPALRVA